MLLQNKRIFVVEDNSDNRTITRVALAGEGALLLFESWGTHATARLLAFAPVDAVILDLMLAHGVSGYDIIGEIHQHPKLAKIPVVAVSAADPSAAIPRCQELGFNGFIPKPIDPDLFPTQIAQVIAGESIWSTGSDE